MKTNLQNLFDYFPGSDSPRPQQIETLNFIQKEFAKGKKYVIARLPTGSGKSHIATTLARSSRPIDSNKQQLLESYEAFKKDNQGNYVHKETFLSGSSYGSVILTVTRSLQNQYIELFGDQIAAKGKNNYTCAVDPNVTVDFAPCLFSSKLKQQCFAEDKCPYYKVRKNALISLDPVLNYRAYFNMPTFLMRRNYLIFDEADKIESELVGQYSITLNYAQLTAEDIVYKKIISDDANEAGLWLSDIFLQIKEQLSDLRQKVSLMANKGSGFDSLLFKQQQRLGKLTNLYNAVMDAVMNWQQCQYLVEHKDNKEVTFVPFDIKPLAQTIFENGDNVLMMSATISNVEEYTKSLGISKDQYSFVDISSTFPAEKSPIYVSNKYSLSFKTIESNLPKVIDMALKICDAHKGEKGLIHTHTNNITEKFKMKARNNPRFIFREAGSTNENIIEDHKKRLDEDTILVSPSLDTGVSLDDDLGRFQIIIKAPYLPLGSKRIKKQFDKNPQYYGMKMLDTLIQMSGRCTRSKEDHSVTYILDGSAVKAITTNKKYLPKYFLERFM